MKYFNKKPITLNAVQFKGYNLIEVIEVLKDRS